MKQKTIAKIGLVLIGIGVLLAFAEAGKQRKIREWMEMNIKVIDNAKERLQTLAHTPGVTEEQFYEAMREEHAFVEIARNSPKY